MALTGALFGWPLGGCASHAKDRRNVAGSRAAHAKIAATLVEAVPLVKLRLILVTGLAVLVTLITQSKSRTVQAQAAEIEAGHGGIERIDEPIRSVVDRAIIRVDAPEREVGPGDFTVKPVRNEEWCCSPWCHPAKLTMQGIKVSPLAQAPVRTEPPKRGGREG